ncbi:MAG: DUF4260 domain-containing protein [Gemmatimonadota bacterium]|nr:DUF4260 domain-containing protein [Gemmatimonadota bacterium]
MNRLGTAPILLRLEGVVVLGASVLAYASLGAPWLLFALLILAPDLSILGYLGGPRIGAVFYNLAHTYAAPALLAALALVRLQPDLVAAALIWTAHIGLDRALGFGLKLPTGFKDTHLGRLGPSGELGT